MPENEIFAEVVLPLAVHEMFTYRVPEDMLASIKIGCRVEVPLGNRKHYAGIVFRLGDVAPDDFDPKFIVDLLDPDPILSEKHVGFILWMADYYNCSIGEVLTAMLPSTLRLQSETLVTLVEKVPPDHVKLTPKESVIIDFLENRQTATLDDLRDLLEQKSVFRLVKNLIGKGLVTIHEKMEEQFKSRTIKMLRLHPDLSEDEDLLSERIREIEKYEKQMDAILALIDKAGMEGQISRKAFLKSGVISPSSVRTLAKKEMILEEDVEVSRLSHRKHKQKKDFPTLTDWQEASMGSIRKGFSENKVVMLHGITGSGKTELYIHLIREVLDSGKQALYLLPEIALTSQLLQRLRNVFGNKVLAYHSRINEQERTEIWNRASGKEILIIGARSAVFLPFSDLGLVVIDESHDQSFKQQDPAPRYHGRDAGIYLASLFGARVILGTATPSLESIYNIQSGKYAYVRMDRRFGDFVEPDIELVDMRKETVSTQIDVQVSKSLLSSIESCMAKEQQVILFRNRRGYAPQLVCDNCGWHAECVNCDIALTYHKPSNQLRCHYCGYRTDPATLCPSCGNRSLHMKGYGTQKVEEYLELTFPDLQIQRMDLDTTRSKNKLETLIRSFELGEVDILVGTQMVTKGLDFDNVGLVCILNADGLLYWPDFRANERAFQLMIQVAGRAGRRTTHSKVLVQTYNPDHPVIRDVKERNFQKFYARELEERKHLSYPPYTRLLRMQLRHKDHRKLNNAVYYLDNLLRPHLGVKLNGPATPPIGRVRTYYLADFLVKLPKYGHQRKQIIHLINKAVEQMNKKKVSKGIRVVFDMDPA